MRLVKSHFLLGNFRTFINKDNVYCVNWHWCIYIFLYFLERKGCISKGVHYIPWWSNCIPKVFAFHNQIKSYTYLVIKKSYITQYKVKKFCFCFINDILRHKISLWTRSRRKNSKVSSIYFTSNWAPKCRGGI